MSNLTRSLMLGGGGSSSGSTYLGPMTWAELQASAYANGSVGLAALGADAAVFVTDWSAVMIPSADKTYWTSSTPIILDRFGSTSPGTDVVYTATGTTCTAVASASAGAKTRCTITGHGLTSANNGVSVYVSGGSNWAVGFYPYTYVDANNIDLTVAWNASFGNPTIYAVNGASLKSTLRTVTVPAGLMQAQSSVTINSTWEITNSANNRYCWIQFGATPATALLITPSSVAGLADERVIRNRGVTNSQITQKNDTLGYTGATPATATQDTSIAWNILFIADPRTVNEFIRLAGETVSVVV